MDNTLSPRWLVRPPPSQRPMRLYCIPYAGGGASAYSGWHEALGPSVEVVAVELPGRGMRFSEKPLESMVQVVDAIVRTIQQEPRKPFALFGHSMGALIAFEVARALQQRRLPMPQQLIVSGCDAPRHPRRTAGMHRLPDTELLEELRRYNGTPPEVLANRELMELLLPMIRADFALAGNYQYHPGLALPIPLTLLLGTNDVDEQVADQEAGWRRETAAEFKLHWFEGDHFFLHGQRDAVLRCVAATLGTTVCA